MQTVLQTILMGIAMFIGITIIILIECKAIWSITKHKHVDDFKAHEITFYKYLGLVNLFSFLLITLFYFFNMYEIVFYAMICPITATTIISGYFWMILNVTHNT